MSFNEYVAFENMIKQGVAMTILNKKISDLYLEHGAHVPNTPENNSIQERLNATKVRLSDTYYQLNERYKNILAISKLAQKTAKKILLETDLSKFPKISYFEIIFSEEQNTILRNGMKEFKESKLVSKKRTRDHFKGVSLDKLLEYYSSLAMHFTKDYTGVQDSTSPIVSDMSNDTTSGDTTSGTRSSGTIKRRKRSRASGSSSGTNHSGGTAKKR